MVQETFLNLYKNIEQFDGRAKITTWLYSITENTCKNLHIYNSANKRQHFSVEIDKCLNLAGNSDIEEEVNLKNIQEKVNNFYKKSKGNNRKRLDVLFDYVSGENKLNITKRTQIHRARKYLREHISHEF
jgi:DNA-directed RNA polymerase specialized sigma24 family protein